jgi:glycosyltransferase involved in cell wall biosynthesis
VRILAVCNRYPPWSLGGYEVAAAGVTEALRRARHEVRVLTTIPDLSDRAVSSEDEDVHRELRWYWRNHQFPALSIREMAALERANAATLRRHLAAFDPDAVLWWAMGGMSLSLLEQVRRAGVPAVGAVGDDWMVYGPQVDRWTRLMRGRARVAAPVAERLIGVPARVDLEHGARWTFNSRYTLETARQTGLRLPEALVIHPGVEQPRFRFREPERWSWRLLCCGRIDPRKGLDTAVDALALLPAQATVQIHGEGEGSYRAELERRAAHLGVADRVRFSSSDHRDVPEVYACADALVFGVRWQEPWGLVPLEAMAIGRPVVASRAGGGAAEYLRDGQNCLQFPPGDAAALASALRRLANDRPLRARLIESGRATAAGFTAAEFHSSLAGELERAVGGPRTQR